MAINGREEISTCVPLTADSEFFLIAQEKGGAPGMRSNEVKGRAVSTCASPETLKVFMGSYGVPASTRLCADMLGEQIGQTRGCAHVLTCQVVFLCNCSVCT